MTSPTVHKFATDLLAAHHHVAEAISRQTTDDRVLKMGEAAGVLYETHGTIQRHFRDLEHHIMESGGLGASGQVKEALTSVSGFLAGLYGQMRSEPVSRMLRDDISAVNFLQTCTEMFHATAKACGDVRFAACAENMLRDHASLILKLHGVLPNVVVRELPGEHLVDEAGGDETVKASREAWHAAAAAAHI